MLPKLIVDPNLKLESSPPSAPSSASKDSYKVTECVMCDVVFMDVMWLCYVRYGAVHQSTPRETNHLNSYSL